MNWDRRQPPANLLSFNYIFYLIVFICNEVVLHSYIAIFTCILLASAYYRVQAKHLA